MKFNNEPLSVRQKKWCRDFQLWARRIARRLANQRGLDLIECESKAQALLVSLVRSYNPCMGYNNPAGYLGRWFKTGLLAWANKRPRCLERGYEILDREARRERATLEQAEEALSEVKPWAAKLLREHYLDGVHQKVMAANHGKSARTMRKLLRCAIREAKRVNDVTVQLA